MVSIVRNFLGGFDEGEEMRKRKERENALARAGEAFSAGQYDQAEEILMPLDPEAAMRFGDWGEQKRQRTRVRGLGEARARGGWRGVQDWARQNNDFDALSLADEGLADEDAKRAKREADDIGWMANTLLTFRGSAATPEQRHAAFLDRARARGIGDAVLSQVEVGDFTDEGIVREARQGLSLADQISAAIPNWQQAGDGSIGFIDQQTGEWVDNTGQRGARIPQAPKSVSVSAGYQYITPQQASALGLPPGAYQRSPEGKIEPIGGQSSMRPLTPGDTIKARQALQGVTTLRSALNNFRDLLRSASASDIAGLGPNAAALTAAHRLLAMQIKSPAALDLGALVGADFAILNDIVGEPGNLKQLVQYGGKDGYLQRLQQVDDFVTGSSAALDEVYAPYANTEGLRSFFQGQGQGPQMPNAPPASGAFVGGPRILQGPQNLSTVPGGVTRLFRDQGAPTPARPQQPPTRSPRILSVED